MLDVAVVPARRLESDEHFTDASAIMDPILLVLDLDETLIFADEVPLDRPADFTVAPYFVYLRPGVRRFLERVARSFRLAVWTSSSPRYADAVTRELFGDAHRLEFVWASDRCTPTRDLESDSWTQSKRLSKLRRHGYRLERVLVVDDSPEKHTRNYGNLVRVLPFHGDAHDRELEHLGVYLESLADAANVRSIEKRRWRDALSEVGASTTSC